MRTSTLPFVTLGSLYVSTSSLSLREIYQTSYLESTLSPLCYRLHLLVEKDHSSLKVAVLLFSLNVQDQVVHRIFSQPCCIVLPRLVELSLREFEHEPLWFVIRFVPLVRISLSVRSVPILFVYMFIVVQSSE